jgi:hypothetical protein
MPARKMRVEVFDSDGNRYKISFEGQVTRDKALRLLEMVELLGGIPSTGTTPAAEIAGGQEVLSKYDKVRMVVQKHFPILWFTSREVQSTFDRELKEPIGLSTVATYLARMAVRGTLIRSGNANSLKYRLARTSVQVAAEQSLR